MPQERLVPCQSRRTSATRPTLWTAFLFLLGGDTSCAEKEVEAFAEGPYTQGLCFSLRLCQRVTWRSSFGGRRSCSCSCCGWSLRLEKKTCSHLCKCRTRHLLSCNNSETAGPDLLRVADLLLDLGLGLSLGIERLSTSSQASFQRPKPLWGLDNLELRICAYTSRVVRRLIQRATDLDEITELGEECRLRGLKRFIHLLSILIESKCRSAVRRSLRRRTLLSERGAPEANPENETREVSCVGYAPHSRSGKGYADVLLVQL